MPQAVAILVLLTVVFSSQASWSAEKTFPSKGVAKIGNGPLPLLVHYINGSGQDVEINLRGLSYDPPNLALSRELAALAKVPCGVGDVVNISKSAIAGSASGADAAGIGRFVWFLSGQYTSNGQTWQFKGDVTPKDDKYNFNKARDGERAFWAEVSTRIGAAFPGKEFVVRLRGTLPVSIAGACNLNSSGEALV